MSSIWRFYKDEQRQWRWQRLTIDRTVIAESHAAHKHYDECIADAQEDGYIVEVSQPKLIQKYAR